MGMNIVANKHPLVYAALIEDEYAARDSRIFNDSNLFCFEQGLEEGGIYCVIEKKEREKAAKGND